MQAAEDNDDETFVYMGGDQHVPRHVRRAKIHVSVKIVPARAFLNRKQLTYVEFHDGIEVIEQYSFFGCINLRGLLQLLGVKIIKERAFSLCCSLTGVEFGGKLETIETSSFQRCSSLTKIRMPSVRTIGEMAFHICPQLSDVELGEGLRRLDSQAFEDCTNLKRINLPLRSITIGYCVFYGCPELAAVDLVMGIHNTVASLHMESWRNEMMDEINRINQVLPTVFAWGKTTAIEQWMESTVHLFDHYKAEHHKILKEATTLLELALWKANLGDNEGGRLEREGVRTTRGRRKRARKEICVTSGASIVIKNVLPFLLLLE